MLRELQTSLQITWQMRIISKWKLNRLRKKCQRLNDMIDICIETCQQNQAPEHKAAA